MEYRSDPNSAHGFVWCASGWTGHAGDGQRGVSAAEALGSEHHLPDRCVAHGAMRFQRLRGDSQQPLFQFIGIRDHATIEILRRTRRVTESFAEQSTGTTLGYGEAPAVLAQGTAHHGRQIILLGTQGGFEAQ